MPMLPAKVCASASIVPSAFTVERAAAGDLAVHVRADAAVVRRDRDEGGAREEEADRAALRRWRWRRCRRSGSSPRRRSRRPRGSRPSRRSVSIVVPESIVATATPPEIPITEMPKMVTCAVAALSAIALIMIPFAPVKPPWRWSSCAPRASATATMTAICTAPPPPPGACASTRVARGRLDRHRRRRRERDVPLLGVAASVCRLLLISSTVMPTEMKPVVTLRLWRLSWCVPSAVTLTAPADRPVRPGRRPSACRRGRSPRPRRRTRGRGRRRRRSRRCPG